MEIFEILALIASIATTWWVTKRYIVNGFALERDNTPRRFAFTLFDIWLLAAAGFFGSAIIAIHLPLNPTLRAVIGLTIMIGGAVLWKRKTDQIIDTKLARVTKASDQKVKDEENLPSL